MMHHIFEKSPYPELKYVEDNIIMITWAEHEKIHNDMYYYKEINKRRKLIKEKYENKTN